MVEYKSDTFVFFVYVFVVFTLFVKLAAFFSAWNPLSLITPTLATVVGIFLIRKDIRVVAWIRLWAIVEIAAAVLFALSRGCSHLLRTTEPLQLGEYVRIGVAVISVVIASAFYFLVPDYIIEKQSEQKSEDVLDITKSQDSAP